MRPLFSEDNRVIEKNSRHQTITQDALFEVEKFITFLSKIYTDFISCAYNSRMHEKHPAIECQCDAFESAVHAIDGLMDHACRMRASDIHIDPHPFETVVRMRVDGQLETIGAVRSCRRSEAGLIA